MRERLKTQLYIVNNKDNSGIDSRIVTYFDQNSPISEQYRIVRTNIEYWAADKECKAILCTSATGNEGKSTTIANLALTYAQQNKRVLLLECDLRFPSLSPLFGLEPQEETLDRVCALNVHTHDHILAGIKRAADMDLGDAFVLAVNTGMLQELVIGDHPLKLGSRVKVIVAAVDLVGSG